MVALLLSLLSMPLPTLAKIKNTNSKIRSQRLLKKYRSQLRIYNKKFSRLRSSLRTLEVNINQKNRKYIKGIKLSKKIIKEIFDFEVDLKNNEQLVKRDYLGGKKILLHYLLNGLTDDYTAGNIYQGRLFKKLLVRNLKDLNSLMKANGEIRDRLEVLRTRYGEYNSVEKSLHLLVSGLEGEKRDVASYYMQSLEEKKNLERLIGKLKANINQKNVSQHFGLPLAKFFKLRSGVKGVTLKYKGSQPVQATGSGKIVYAGRLASYGKVIMIDHGNDLRSVILGDIVAEVKKGDKVAKGVLIGYTKESSDSLYFEVRKMNVAQKTVAWLDKKYQKRKL